MKSFAFPLFLLLAGVLLLPACGNDDESPASLSGELTVAGGWGLADYESNLAATAAPLVDGLTDTQLASIGYTREDLTSDLLITAAFIEAPVPPCNQNDAAIFNADGSVTSNYSDDCGTDIFIESENPLAPDEERGETKTYLLDGNVLTLTSMGTFSDSPVETYEIVELTATSLKIRLSDQTLTEQLLDTENLGEVDFKGMFVQLNFVAL